MADNDEVSENRPLVSNDPKVSTSGNCKATKSRWPGIIELYLVINIVSNYPRRSVIHQYMFRKVGYSMGIDVDNLTHPANSSFGDCGTDRNDTAYILREEVLAATSQWMLYTSLAGFLPRVLAAVFFGATSDKLGRKLCLISGPLGCISHTTIEACAIYFGWPVWAFLLTGPIAGVIGNDLVMIGTLAFIADTVAQRHLALRMTIVSVVQSASEGIGDLGMGYMIHDWGYFWPLLFMIAGNALSVLYAIFLIPETVAHTTGARFFNATALTKGLKLLTNDNGSDRRWKTNLLLLSYFCTVLFNLISIWPLIEMNAPLCWNSVLIGYYNAATNALQCIGGVVGGGMKRYFAEEWIIIVTKLIGMLEFIYLPFVQNTIMMFFVPVIGVFDLVSLPVTKAVLSTYVGPDEQGSLFAVVQIVSKVAVLTGKLAANNIYTATILWIQGRLVSIVAAAACLLSTLLVLIFTLKTKQDRILRLERESKVVTPSREETSYGTIQS